MSDGEVTSEGRGEPRGLSAPLRALVALGAAALAIPAVGSAWALERVEDALAKQVHQGQVTAARAAAIQVDAGLDFATDLARAAAHRPGFVEWVRAGDIEGQRRVLNNVVETTGAYRSLTVIGPDGRPRLEFPVPMTPATRASLGKTGETTLLGEGDALVVVREPIGDDAGAGLGELVTEISLHNAVPVIAGLRLGETGRATVATTSGQVLVTGEGARAGTAFQAPEMLRALEKQRVGTLDYRSPVLKRNELAAVAPVAGHPWSVIVTQSSDEAYAPAYALRKGVLVGLGGLYALAAVMAVLIVRRFARHERNMAIAETRLANYAADLERSNQDLEQFAYVASHDLRQPVHTVGGFAELLAESYGDRLDDDGREFLSFIRSGVERMAALIDDLLTFARVGRSALDLRETDVGASIAAALDNLRSTLADTGAEVSVGDMPMVKADGGQLTSLFQNLIANALNYRSERPPRIDITATRTAGEWVFSVADNGLGIDAASLERIFTMFQRLHGQDRPGTGIGLAICQRVVERHGGRIWVESEPGRGSTFSFSIPEGGDAARPDDVAAAVPGA